MLTVWGRANSINVMRAFWTGAQLASSFQRVAAGMEHGGLLFHGRRSCWRDCLTLVPVAHRAGRWATRERVARTLAGTPGLQAIHGTATHLKHGIGRARNWPDATPV